MLRSFYGPFKPLLLLFFFTAGQNIAFAQHLPIKPGRTISFTTTEGSYMNVDVSPDGKTLAFDLLGDIYTIPATGGTAKQLTRGIALHARPVWSPDGKYVADISDASGSAQLHVLDINGRKDIKLSRLTYQIGEQISVDGENQNAYEIEPAWTTDSRFIAFGSKTYSLDKTLPATRNMISQILRYSADGRYCYGIDSNNLCRYEIKSGQKKVLISKLPKYLSSQISPDGKYWCYIADVNGQRQLIARDLQNGSSHELVPSLIIIDPRYRDGSTASHHFSFSPDSKTIYIGYGGKIHRIDVGSDNNIVIPFKADVHVDMGVYNHHKQYVSLNDFDVKFCRSASVSPNGKHLIFQALNKIYIQELPKGKPHVLCPQPFGQFQAAWSPDSKWIAYTSWCDTVGGFLWKTSISGGPPVQLTAKPGQYNHPCWYPDGKNIAVLHGSNKLNSRDPNGRKTTGKLELVNTSNGSIQVIADTIPIVLNTITVSTNGRKLIYTPHFQNLNKRPYEENQIVSYGFPNGGIKVLAEGADITFSRQQCLSPDGRYVVYSADEELYLALLDSVTKSIILSTRTSNGGEKLEGIRFASGVDPHWENGGKLLAWTYSNKFYRIDPDKIMAAAQDKSTRVNSLDSVTKPLVAVTPDQVMSLKVPSPGNYAKGLIALRNVRILTMHRNQVVEHGTILIRNGRIASIGPKSTAIPNGAKIVDLSEKTVMPGLIDLHLHMYEISTEILSQQNWQLLTALAYGVTTARDPSSSYDSFGYAELLRTGQMTGPRFYTVGRAMRFPDGVLHFDGQEDADNVVRRRVLLGGTEIKQYTLPTRIQREWLLLACEKYGVNMTNEGYYEPLLQLGQIKDGSTGIEHAPVFSDAYNDVIQLRAKAQTYLTATLQVCYGAEEARNYLGYKYWRYPDAKWTHFVYESHPEAAPAKMIDGRLTTTMVSKDTINPGFIAASRVDARIFHAGGLITMGSHGNDQGIGPHNEIWALQMGGLTNLEALQAATINGARALGIQKDLGSLEVGKIADLIVLDKNPLEDIHNTRTIKYVMKGGILYDGDTLDELWPVKKKCPEWKLKNTNENTAK